jgi:hypothetical protein
MSNETTEKLFIDSLKNVNNIWYKKIKVAYQQEPFDFLVLAPSFKYAIEVKETEKDYFYKNQVKPHQIVGLRRFWHTSLNFKSYVLIRYLNENDSFLVPLIVFESLPGKIYPIDIDLHRLIKIGKILKLDDIFI